MTCWERVLEKAINLIERTSVAQRAIPIYQPESPFYCVIGLYRELDFYNYQKLELNNY